jgi:hypothetical protein
MFKKFLVFAVALALIMPVDALAGKSGSSGGSSRSSSSGFSGSRSSGSSFSGSRSSGSGFSSKPSTPSHSSSSSSRSSPSGFSSKPSTPPATHSTPSTSSSRSSPSGFSSSPTTKSPAATTNTTTSKPVQTALDSKVAKANTVSAPSYKTKEQAISAFKEKNASTYTSKFTTEPKTRPEYIPPSTSVGGKTVNISYNAGFGGYGYYHPTLGTWMAYDMMHDAAMMSMMMNRHGGYTYVDGPGYGGGVVITSPGPMSYWAGVILIIFLFAFIIFMIRILREV